MGERILIVDDDPLLCSLLRMALRREGYETEEMYSGDAALDYLAETTRRSDSARCHDGRCERLRRGAQAARADPELSEIPVIFLTARVDAISQKTGLDIGAVEYLTKPITPDAVDRAYSRGS